MSLEILIKGLINFSEAKKKVLLENFITDNQHFGNMVGFHYSIYSTLYLIYVLVYLNLFFQKKKYSFSTVSEEN